MQHEPPNLAGSLGSEYGLDRTPTHHLGTLATAAEPDDVTFLCLFLFGGGVEGEGGIGWRSGTARQACMCLHLATRSAGLTSVYVKILLPMGNWRKEVESGPGGWMQLPRVITPRSRGAMPRSTDGLGPPRGCGSPAGERGLGNGYIPFSYQNLIDLGQGL